MSSEKDYAVQFVAREQAELRPVERDPTPLAPDEIAGRSHRHVDKCGNGIDRAPTLRRAISHAAPAMRRSLRSESVGDDVDDVKVGDHIFCMGNHQSYQRIKRDAALLLPEGLAPETGVFARLMNVSLTTLTTTTARPPERVVVTGLGIVGKSRRPKFH